MDSSFLNLKDFLQFDFLQYALLATIMISLLSGLLSPLILAKKYSFIGEGISHSTLVGLALAFGLFSQSGPLTLLFWTLTPTLILVIFLAYATYEQKLPTDSLIGIFLSTSMALGVLLHQILGNQKTDLLGLLFGNMLFLNKEDLFVLASLVFFLFLFFGFTFKKWIFIIFDPLTAKLSGLKVKTYHYLFFIFMALYTVTSIKLVGSVLMNTLLLIPGAFAYKMANNMKNLFIYSLSFAFFSSLIGLIVANWKNWPTGATLALTQFFCFFLIRFIMKIKKETLKEEFL